MKLQSESFLNTLVHKYLYKEYIVLLLLVLFNITSLLLLNC